MAARMWDDEVTGGEVEGAVDDAGIFGYEGGEGFGGGAGEGG